MLPYQQYYLQICLPERKPLIYDVDEFLEINRNIYTLNTYIHRMGFVNIIVHDETREKLNKLKSNSRESYNDVITRLIDEHDRSKEKQN